MEKKFDPKLWIDRDKAIAPEQTQHEKAPSEHNDSLLLEVEEVVRRIEANNTDITPSYSNWCNLGFALADGLGESGRSLFHRISCFNAGYNAPETDRQYTACLNAHGSGITINTFFATARDAGISLSGLSLLSNDKTDKTDKIFEGFKEEDEPLPTFSHKIKPDLCGFLSAIADKGSSPQDADLLLLSSLVVLSGCFPKSYFTIYDARVVYPPLFLFISARAATGKGRMEMTRHLGQCIDQEKRDHYQHQLQEYKEAIEQRRISKEISVDVPDEPVPQMLYMPANSSAAAFCSTLTSNQGEGIMFETEGDTLTNTLRQDYGNYSDILRKSFHHELISYLRKQNQGQVKDPRLAVILSGTPAQLTSLVPSTENGLFSRFMFYGLSYEPEFKNKFAAQRSPLADDFTSLGEMFYQEIYQVFRQHPARSIYFTFTTEQQEQIIRYYQDKYLEYLHIFGDDVAASIFRLTWISIRLGMVLSALRLMDTSCYDLPHDPNGQISLICDDRDFRTVMSITDCLLIHMSNVFLQVERYAKVNIRTKHSSSPKEDHKSFINQLHSLPEFSRNDACTVAAGLHHPPGWADRLLAHLCKEGLLLRSSQGVYTWTK